MGDIVSHQFFGQHMFAGHHGLDGDGGMEMQRQRDDDRFDPGILDQVVVVAAFLPVVNADRFFGFVLCFPTVFLQQPRPD